MVVATVLADANRTVKATLSAGYMEIAEHASRDTPQSALSSCRNRLVHTAPGYVSAGCSRGIAVLDYLSADCNARMLLGGMDSIDIQYSQARFDVVIRDRGMEHIVGNAPENRSNRGSLRLREGIVTDANERRSQLSPAG